VIVVPAGVQGLAIAFVPNATVLRVGTPGAAAGKAVAETKFVNDAGVAAFSAVYMDIALFSWDTKSLMLAHSAVAVVLPKRGIATAAKMAIIAITTANSIKVKPFALGLYAFFMNGVLLLLFKNM